MPIKISMIIIPYFDELFNSFSIKMTADVKNKEEKLIKSTNASTLTSQKSKFLKI